MTEKKRSWLPVEYVLFKVGSLPFPREFYRGEKVKELENDALWIAEQLKRLNGAQRVRACLAYDAVYLEQGRYEANTRLRLFADRCEKANRGDVKKFGG